MQDLPKGGGRRCKHWPPGDETLDTPLRGSSNTYGILGIISGDPVFFIL